MGKHKRCGIYLRVSTQDQDTSMQRSDLIQYGQARNWDFEIYEDKATGTNTQRHEFQKMLRDAKARKFDTLLIWKFDRFARSLTDLVVNLQLLTELGITFISLKDQVDLS